MNLGLRKVTALALALTLALVPWMGSAALAEADFDPGELYGLLLGEAFEGGRLLEGRATWQANDLTVLEEGTGKELADAIAKLIDGLELRFSGVDDYDQRLYSLSLSAAGKEVVSFRVREDAESLRVTSNLLPGMTFVMPAETLTGQDLMENEDVVQLISAAYLTYFGRVAAWVSEIEEETADLYVHTFLDESDDTDVRDAVARTQSSRVRSSHFKQLVRDLTDTFYADSDSQRAVANLLAPLGVIRADVRRWADELPLLFSNGFEETDAATDFVFSYDDAGDIVGFDGVMPRMFEPFFFDEGSLTYSRKTGMDDVRHAVHGEARFGEGRLLAGDAQIVRGEIIDNTRRDEVSVGLAYTDSDAGGVFRAATVRQDLYLAQEGQDIHDMRLTVDVGVAEGEEEDSLRMEVTARGETEQVGDLDFAHSNVVEMDVSGMLSLTSRWDVASREYVPEEWADVGEVYDLSGLTDEEAGALMTALRVVPSRMIMLVIAALPAELMQTLMEDF